MIQTWSEIWLGGLKCPKTCRCSRSFPLGLRLRLPSVHTIPTGHWYGDRKSTRLNSSHVKISYAVFCLKKKTCVLPFSVRSLFSILLLRPPTSSLFPYTTLFRSVAVRLRDL